MPISGGSYTLPTNNFAQPVPGNRVQAVDGAATLTDIETALDTLTGVVSDGDKGDVTVSSNGTVWNIDAGVITDVEVSGSAAIAGTKLLFTPAGPGAVASTVQAKLRERVSILDFGGVEANASANALAIERAKDAGVDLFIPAGEFLLEPMTIDSAVSFYGAGKTSVIKWASDSATTSLMDFSGAEMLVEFNNLCIDSNRQGHTDNSSYFGAIEFAGLDGSALVLNNVFFKNGRIQDVVVVGPTASGESIQFVMRGCRFKDGLVGSASRAAQFVQAQENVECVWTGNIAMQPDTPASYGRAGFVMQRGSGLTTPAGSLAASGNSFLNVGRGTADTLGCIDVYSGANGVSITGNRAKNVPGRAFSVKGDQSSISITGNVAENILFSTAVGISIFQDLFDTEQDKDCVIANNVVTGSAADGIFADGEGDSGSARFKNILIANNVVSGCTGRSIYARYFRTAVIRGNDVDGGTGSIVAADCNDLIVVDDNSVRNSSSHAIDITAVAGSALANCDIVAAGNRIRSAGARAVSIGASCRSYEINYNDINGCTIAIVTTGSTESSGIIGNKARAMSSGLWTKSGTDTLLTYRDNRTTTALGFATRSLTIASGAITVFADWHWVDTEAAAASDDVDTVNGGIEGRVVTLRAASNTRDVVMKDGTGNLRLNGDFTMNHSQDSITLMYTGSDWVEMCRSDNAV